MTFNKDRIQANTSLYKPLSPLTVALQRGAEPHRPGGLAFSGGCEGGHPDGVVAPPAEPGQGVDRAGGRHGETLLGGG